MKRVALKGWLAGFNKISLNHLLRQYVGMGLVDAEQTVELLLAGEEIVVECADEEAARLFCEQADRIGAACASADPPEPEGLEITTRTSVPPAPPSQTPP
jgi:hypothetical protein